MRTQYLLASIVVLALGPVASCGSSDDGANHGTANGTGGVGVGGGTGGTAIGGGGSGGNGGTGGSAGGGSPIGDYETGPGQGPGPDCGPTVAPCDDTNDGSCARPLTIFDPRQGEGYWDLPINGETDSNQYRSFARKDAIGVIKYAVATVACKTANWNWGFDPQQYPVGLYDMSEQDGSIPGTSIGKPGHPSGSHVSGHDVDMSYYRIPPAPDNAQGQAVCPVSPANANHCTGAPDKLDKWRTAMFVLTLLEDPWVRLVGMDGQVGPLVADAMTELCSNGWGGALACNKRYTGYLAYETTNQGGGWYYTHQHHMHVSYCGAQIIEKCYQGGTPRP